MKIKFHHVFFMAVGIGPQLALVAVCKQGGWIAPIMLLSYLFIPCSDPQFGQGRRFHWVRQTIFASAAVVAIVLMFL